MKLVKIDTDLYINPETISLLLDISKAQKGHNTLIHYNCGSDFLIARTEVYIDRVAEKLGYTDYDTKGPRKAN